MPISRTTAIAAVRQRIADTTADYQYADTLLISLLTAALREMETEIKQVDPDYFYAEQIVTGYTDALDPGTYSLYALPSDLARLVYIDRADVSSRPKLWQYTTLEAAVGRFPGNLAGTVSFGSASFTLPQMGSNESISIRGDRFQVLPAPTAAGPLYGVNYLRQIRVPQGDNDILDVPAQFEEALIQSAGLRAVERDEGPMADSMRLRLYGGRNMEGELPRAKRAITSRNGRSRVLMAGY